MYKIIKYLFVLVIFLAVFLYKTNLSFASTIYSNDFTLVNDLSNFQEFFGHCIPSPTGLSCFNPADEQYLNTLPNIACISMDYTDPSHDYDQFALTEQTDFTKPQNLVILVPNYNGHIGLYTSTTWPNVTLSSINTPTSKHNYMLCRDNNTFTGYLDGFPAVSLVEANHTTLSFFVGSSPNVQVTHLIVTDSLPTTTPTPTPTPTPSQPQLSVTPLKQNAGGWQNMTYDLANIWSPGNPTIGTWGCALTSAVMVLNYYNIHTIPQTNLAMNPGNLDAWLGIQPDGYIPNGNVNWLAISRLTKLANANNPNFPFHALEYTRSNFADTTSLLADLNAGQPDILEEPGHFVVATGQNGSTFNINDPFYNRTDLTSYNNTFTSLGRYIPSFTNLSYILFTGDPSLTLTLKDNTNTPVGTSYIQQPLHGANTNLVAGNPIQELYLQQPETGNYTLTISGSTNQPYSITGYIYDINGNVKPFSLSGIVGPNNQSTITFNVNPQNQGTFLDDLNNFYTLHFFSNGTYTSLKNVWGNVQKNIQNKTLLGTLATLLKAHKVDISSNNAYQILLADIQYLQAH